MRSLLLPLLCCLFAIAIPTSTSAVQVDIAHTISAGLNGPLFGAVALPEPATALLLTSGLLGLTWSGRRRTH